jgi:glycerol uptake facilitator protein/aquaporin Z
LDQFPELLNKAKRVSVGRLARDSAFELILTSVLLFGVVSIVRWVIGPSPISRTIPGIHAELWIVGAAVAFLLAGLILSPLGRASGGHTNPAISGWPVALRGLPGAASSHTPPTVPGLLHSGSSPVGGVGNVAAGRSIWRPAKTGWSSWELFARNRRGMCSL